MSDRLPSLSEDSPLGWIHQSNAGPVRHQLKMSSHNGVVPAPGKGAISRSPLRRCISWTGDKIRRLGIRYFVFLIFMGALSEILGRQSGLSQLRFHLLIE